MITSHFLPKNTTQSHNKTITLSTTHMENRNVTHYMSADSGMQTIKQILVA